MNRPAPDPAERIRRVPLIGALGPERLAAALSVIVVAFAVLVVVLTRSIGGPPAGDPGAGGASPSPVRSPAPDRSDTGGPSAIPGSSAPGPAVSAPAASPAVTLPPTSAAWAGDARLDVGFQVDTNYEDNVFSGPNDEEGDFSVNVGPIFNAYDRRGDFRWKLDYNPTYLKYREFDALDDWEQYAFGELEWVPDERTRIFANAQYVDASSFLRLAAADPSLGDTGASIVKSHPRFIAGGISAARNGSPLSCSHDSYSAGTSK